MTDLDPATDATLALLETMLRSDNLGTSVFAEAVSDLRSLEDLSGTAEHFVFCAREILAATQAFITRMAAIQAGTGA